MKRNHHLTAIQKKLISTLDKLPGFFRHGNKIRLTIHLDVRESAVLALLDKKATETVKDIIDHELGFISNALEWDGQEFWLEPNLALIGMIDSYSLFTDFDAIQNDVEYVYIGKPFVVCKETIHSFSSIPCQILNGKLLIGDGDQYIISKSPISQPIIELLKKLTFYVQIELDD